MAEILKVRSRFGEHGPRAVPRERRVSRRLGRLGAWLSLLLVFGALLTAVSPSFNAPESDVPLGSIWTQATVVAPFSFSVRDVEAEEKARRRIEERHDKVFRLDVGAEEEAQQRLNEIFVQAQRFAQSGETTPSLLEQRLQKGKTGVDLQEQTVAALLAHLSNTKFRSDLVTILHNVYSSRGVSAQKSLFATAARTSRLALVLDPYSAEPVTTPTAEGVLQYPAEVQFYLESRYLPSFGVSPQVQSAYLDIAFQLIRPNLFYDREETVRRKEAAQERVRYMGTVEPETRIIRTGERVTALQLAMLEKLGAKMRYHNMLKLLGSSLFVVLSMGFVLLYARKFKPELSFSSRNILMLALPVIFAVSIGRFVPKLSDNLQISTYAFPAGWVGMLCAILFGARFGMILVVVSCLLFGVGTSTLFGLNSGMSFAQTLVGVTGGITAVVSLYTIKERKEVLLAGLRVALANFLAIIAVHLIFTPESLSLVEPVGGILNGLACYVLTLGALPVFETLFHVTTDVRLMELTSTNHPLLRLMEERAPGSFQHVLNVAKLAESAAEAIGANYLLVRAGAYFHDIGKILKPKYFTENQVTPEERKIHSRLSPYMSNLIIKNHVKEGIELGRRYGLPEKVVDFIPQHHGTGLIKYFYTRALQKAEANDMVHEVEFRYPGPRPQTIEAAIVMLADTVEATATAKFSGRSVKEDDLRKLIRDAIFDKFHDGQFDECHMTFRDLYRISESFVHTLMARFHQRIDYPKLAAAREVRDITHGDRPTGATTTAAAH